MLNMSTADLSVTDVLKTAALQLTYEQNWTLWTYLICSFVYLFCEWQGEPCRSAVWRLQDHTQGLFSPSTMWVQ